MCITPPPFIRRRFYTVSTHTACTHYLLTISMTNTVSTTSRHALLLALVLLAAAPLAFAQTNASVDASVDAEVRTTDAVDNELLKKRAQEALNAVKERTTQLRTDGTEKANDNAVRAQERAAERATRVSEQTAERIRTVLANMTARINNIVERLGGIADRVESRANELADRDADVSAALSFVADARTELRTASVIINEDLDAEIAAALEAEDPKAAFSSVKETVREAQGHVRAAHTALRSAVESLKQTRGQNDEIR